VRSAELAPDGLTTNHLLVIISVFVIVLLICLFVIPIRYRERKRLAGKIPRTVMPFLRQGDISVVHQKVILHHIRRAKGISVKPTVKSANNSHLGWGAPGTEYSKVHFKTSIAKSYLIIERAAIHKDRNLLRPPTMSIRDYMSFLEQTVVGLNHNLCRFYTETYEKARFSEAEFTLDEYTNFMAKFLVLLQAFENDQDAFLSPPPSSSSSASKL